jgi:hypothetical protein
MDNLIISLKVIAPLMIYMLIGVFLKRRGILNEKLNSQVNGLIVKVFLPFMMFKNIYQADLSGVSGGFGLYTVCGLIVAWVIFILLFRLRVKDPARIGSMVQGSFRSNIIIFGMAIAENLFGGEGLLEMALTSAAAVPTYNVLSVVILEVCGQKARMQKAAEGPKSVHIDAKSILYGILVNKLIWGAILGFAVNLSHVPVPSAVSTVVSGMSGVVTPLAFITLGASFRLSAAKTNVRALTVVTLLKLIVLPLAFLALPIYWGWNRYLIGAMLLASGAPTAISSYPMAEGLGCDGELAGEIVVVTSVASILTMFLWIFGLKQAGLL